MRLGQSLVIFSKLYFLFPALSIVSISPPRPEFSYNCFYSYFADIYYISDFRPGLTILKRFLNVHGCFTLDVGRQVANHTNSCSSCTVMLRDMGAREI